MLDHGGNLRSAVARFGRPVEDWIDISTGINPHAYPAPVLRADIWHRLPEDDPALTATAQQYYGAPLMLAVAGTQAAIQALPRLRPPSRVSVAAPAYAEHAHHWSRHGHAMGEVPYDEIDKTIDDSDVLVICNPNNPTGARVPPERLLDWAGRLAARGGWLVVDEAFCDMTPEMSVARHTDQAGLIVLRSPGKFFGLAGLRLGFVAARSHLLDGLADLLGPWTVSAAAQHIGRLALADAHWQSAMRQALEQEAERLRRLLRHADIVSSGCALFQWWPEPESEAFAEHLARQGIWVRRFVRGAGGIRLGLPPHEAGWNRLEQALAAWRRTGRPA